MTEGGLPYKEQLHWQQYNEKSNGGISARAYGTDFKCQWPQLAPLEELKKELEQLGNIKFHLQNNSVAIWSPKGGNWETASKGLFYLKTENPNAWGDFIIALSNTVNEGFKTQELKKIACCYGYTNRH